MALNHRIKMQNPTDLHDMYSQNKTLGESCAKISNTFTENVPSKKSARREMLKNIYCTVNSCKALVWSPASCSVE